MHRFVLGLCNVPGRRANVHPLIAGPLAGPFRNGLDIVQRLMAFELGHDFVKQIRVNLGVFVPSAETLVRAFEEFQVDFHI